MMTGLLLWREKTPGKREKVVRLEEKRVLHARFLCAEMLREERMPELLLRRRLLSAVRRLRKAGVTAVVLPEGAGPGLLPERTGLHPVSTVPLRQLIAADWVRLELARRGLPDAGARVTVSAPMLTGEVVRTVTELVLRHRYVAVDIPRGTEEFARRLRREYGVSLLDGADPAQLTKADALVCFGTEPARKELQPVVLRLADESLPLPELLLPPTLSDQLPAGADRGQLLAALLQAGVLRPGQVSVAAGAT